MNCPTTRITQICQKKHKAFTLVELLVVIGIISVLVAILLPALNKAREAAKTVMCLSNEKQIMQGLRMYAHDNNGWLPYEYFSPPYTIWASLLAGGVDTVTETYIQDRRVFFCPSRLPLASSARYLDRVMNDHNGSNWAYISYGANRYGAMTKYSETSYHPIKISEPGADASSLMVFTEALKTSLLTDGTHDAYGWYEAYPNKTASSATWALWAHGNVVNSAFLDGHCASVPAGDLGWDAKTKTWIVGKTSDPAWRAGPPWYLATFTKH